MHCAVWWEKEVREQSNFDSIWLYFHLFSLKARLKGQFNWRNKKRASMRPQQQQSHKMWKKCWNQHIDIDLLPSLPLSPHRYVSSALKLLQRSINMLTIFCLPAAGAFSFIPALHKTRAIGNLINRCCIERRPNGIAFCVCSATVNFHHSSTPLRRARVLIDNYLTYRMLNLRYFFVRNSHYFMQFKNLSQKKCFFFVFFLFSLSSCTFYFTQCQKLKSRWKIHNNLQLYARTINRKNKKKRFGIAMHAVFT